MKSFIKGRIEKLIYRIATSKTFNNIRHIVETRRWEEYKKQFKYMGAGSRITEPCRIINPQFISIGNNFGCLYNFRIEAIKEYGGVSFAPEIIIGDNVSVNSDCHIGAIDKVIIGNNVLLASRVYISDHSHGEVTAEALAIAPGHRKLYSKGPVIIEDNVWIGEGVSVMPGVTIGKNSIIGTNAVVTKSVPPNSVVAGIPARVIRTLQ